MLEDLKWRYATKKFAPEHTVSKEHINYLKEAVQLAASSFGLQPYKVLVINNPEIKAALYQHSFGQTQVKDCSHFFVFCHSTTFSEERLQKLIALKAKAQGATTAALKGYYDFMHTKLTSMNEEQWKIWSSKQAYIAMGNLLNAAAHLKIDTCPMEGFLPDKYNSVLNLSAKGLSAAVAVAVGYRSKDDPYQHYQKVRFPKEELFM